MLHSMSRYIWKRDFAVEGNAPCFQQSIRSDDHRVYNLPRLLNQGIQPYYRVYGQAHFRARLVDAELRDASENTPRSLPLLPCFTRGLDIMAYLYPLFFVLKLPYMHNLRKQNFQIWKFSLRNEGACTLPPHRLWRQPYGRNISVLRRGTFL